MLSGFNTNYRYRGVLFHVQTEDSGRENPHVITHLFHGGNIMASEKRDYSELLVGPAGAEVEGAVRKLMEGQHKSMLKRLSRGEYDPEIESRMGPEVFRAAILDDTAEPPPVTEEALPPPPSPPSPTSKRSPRTWLAPEAVEELPSASQAKSPRVDSGRPTLAEATILEAPEPIGEPPRSSSRLSRVFGERVVTEKPLDEVVLDYLIENARKRKRTTK